MKLGKNLYYLILGGILIYFAARNVSPQLQETVIAPVRDAVAESMTPPPEGIDLRSLSPETVKKGGTLENVYYRAGGGLARAQTVTFTPEDAGTVVNVTARNITVSRKGRPDVPVESGGFTLNLADPDTMDIRNFSAESQGQKAAFDRLTFAHHTGNGGFTTEIKLTGLKAGLSGKIPLLGGNVLAGDLSLTILLDTLTKTAGATLNVTLPAVADFSADVQSVVTADAPAFDPKDPTAFFQAAGLPVRKLGVRLENKGFMDRILTDRAEKAKISREDLILREIENIDKITTAAKVSPAVQALAEEAKTFFRTPGTIELVGEPAQPVDVSTIVPPTLENIVEKLNIKPRKNPEKPKPTP
jgi:hypothetical protein